MAATTSSTQRGGYNREVEWWLTELARLMGQRSNFGGLVAVIERGGTGGNSGTKGCGMIRIEPFENAGILHSTRYGERSVHGDFSRMRLCERAWSDLSIYARWLLTARYCYSREKLPPGIHGQLGDLSAVAFVVAQFSDYARLPGSVRKPMVDRILEGASKKDALVWAEKSAARELGQAHGLWDVCRAHADVMAELRSA